MSLIDSTAYEHLNGRKKYRGLVLKDSEFRKYLNTRINEKFYDVDGIQDLQKIFDDIHLTGFDPETLKSLFENAQTPLDWKIGEKISECFLEDYGDSIFPYNDNRDAKDSKSNLPGTDMVGFVKIGTSTLFLFGEVKTSDQDKNPPSVVHGQDGLIHQLNEIKDDPTKRKELILWLGHKISPLSDDNKHKIAWQDAAISYHGIAQEFKIFGVMIRGVTPDEKDLKPVFEKVVLNMRNETYFELLSLYLPILKSQYAAIMGV